MTANTEISEPADEWTIVDITADNITLRQGDVGAYIYEFVSKALVYVLVDGEFSYFGQANLKIGDDVFVDLEYKLLVHDNSPV